MEGNNTADKAEKKDSTDGEIAPEMAEAFRQFQDNHKSAAIQDQLGLLMQQIPSEQMLVEMNKSHNAGGKDEAADEMLEAFLSNSNIKMKGNIMLHQMHAAVVLSHLDGANSDLEPTANLMRDIIASLMEFSLSTDAFARKQDENVLRARFQGGEVAGRQKDSIIEKMASAASNPFEKD